MLRPTTPSIAGTKRDGGEHGDRNGSDVATAKPLRKSMPISSMPSSEMIDGAAGEHDRPTAGAQAVSDRRRRRRVADVQFGAEAGDDEQGVVDADAEADHGGDRVT